MITFTADLGSDGVLMWVDQKCVGIYRTEVDGVESLIDYLEQQRDRELDPEEMN
jgi:hypothetical protein